MALAAEPGPDLAKAGNLLGRFAGRKVPSEADLKTARVTSRVELVDLEVLGHGEDWHR